MAKTSIIDYVVVFSIFLITSYFLMFSPRKMLLLLPAFLSLDFFVPLGTQLTPSRYVPLMLGCWLILRGKWIAPKPYGFVLFGLLLTMFASLIWALLHGDSGSRPIFRFLNYLSLIFIFLFVLHNILPYNRMTRRFTAIKLSKSMFILV